MKKGLTFILPTMNRADYVCRAVDSCLACHSEKVTPHVLVIDGMSDDGSFELLRERYGANPQVEIVRHERIGFQRTAYFGALRVRTEYATFMYDDDVITPYFCDMFDSMVAAGKDFVMGYGQSYNVEKVYPFQPIREYQLYPKFDALQGYFGCVDKVKYFNLPVSPICLIVSTEHLKRWVGFSQDFAGKAPIRQYFMIDRNIGPDIMLYLSGILKERDSVLFAQSVVGQFSEHTDSMSIGYGKLHLQIGYWLGRVWAFEEVCRQGNKRAAARCAAFLLLFGAKILLGMPRSPDRRWFWQFLGEIAKVKLAALKQGFYLPMLGGLFQGVAARIASGHKTALPQ
jgi:glycosyltransferase involved in cell wall biosynthesis